MKGLQPEITGADESSNSLNAKEALSFLKGKIPDKQRREELRKKVGEKAGDIKDKIVPIAKKAGEYIVEGFMTIKIAVTDPEKREQLVDLINKLLETVSNLKNKEEAKKENKQVVKEMEEKGEIIFSPKTDKPSEVEDNEIMKDMQILPVNTHAIVYNLPVKNKKGEIIKYKYNTLGRELKNMGIIPHIIKGSSTLFKNGVGSFDDFKERVRTLDSKNDLNNGMEVLSRCAIGKYQIVPRFHFEKIEGWTSGTPEKKLQIIHNFLRSETVQDNLNGQIIEELGERGNWDPYVMAAEYYSGGKGREKMKKYRTAIKNGEIEVDSLLSRKQAHSYESIMHYSEGVVSSLFMYAKVDEIDIDIDKVPPEIEKIKKYFQMAIAKRETGYLEGKLINV